MQIRTSMVAGFKKVAAASAVALFLAILGIFGSIGYQSRLVRESFTLNDEWTTNIDVVVEATFNPVLHPVHWLAGHGYWLEDFSGGKANVIGGPNWSGEHAFGNYRYGTGSGGQMPSGQSADRTVDYYADATMYMTTWGFLENLGVLFVLTIAIEASETKIVIPCTPCKHHRFPSGNNRNCDRHDGWSRIRRNLQIQSFRKEPLEQVWGYLWERTPSDLP